MNKRTSQAYFEVQNYRAVPDGTTGPINTRAKLKTYDPGGYFSLAQSSFQASRAVDTIYF